MRIIIDKDDDGMSCKVSYYINDEGKLTKCATNVTYMKKKYQKEVKDILADILVNKLIDV